MPERVLRSDLQVRGRVFVCIGEMFIGEGVGLSADRIVGNGNFFGEGFRTGKRSLMWNVCILSSPLCVEDLLI